MISRIFATLPLLLLSLPALGAELTWGASGNGGSGAWNSANWFDGNTTVNWPNTGGSAVFGGLPGTVTVAGGFLVENLEFRTAGYLLDGFFLRSSSTGLTINTLADAISNVSIFSGSDPNSGIFTKKGPATLTIDSLEGFKQINILSGELRASTNIDTGEAAFSFSSDSAARLTFGDTFSTGGLQGGSVLSEIYPLDSPGTGGSGTRFLSISDIGGSFAGILRDNGASKLAVEKLSGGQQEFTASNSYSGPTTIHEGTISFAGQGSALNTALTVRAQGTLLLDNTSVAQSNRISDFAAISLGGNLILQGNSLAPVAEEAGDLIPSGHPVIQVLAASSQPATLTFRNFTPALAAATIPVFIGTRLGQTSGPGVANIRFATVPALVGGGGGNASTTLSILPGAYGGEAGPESLLTYDVSGLRPLSGNEYVHNSLTAGAFTNVTLDIPVAIAGARTVNALRMEDGSVVSGDGELTIGSGTILALSGKTRLMETILHFGPITGNLFTVGDLTIGSRITGSKGLHKSGPGTLVLAGSNSYTGKTQIIAGTVRLENDLALGNTLEGTILTTGAALELIGGLSIGSEPLILSGNGPQGRGALRGLGGENSWAGDITALADDTVIGVETGSLTLSGKFEGPSLIKTGSGLLSVNGDNSLLTRITLSGGTLRSHGQPDTNPVIGTEVQLNRGRLEIAPAGAGADVSLQLSNNDSLSYSGNAILMLDRGEHSSLSVTIGSTDVGENVFRLNTGTLVIVPASGQLGTVEKLKEEFTSGFVVQNGIVTPSIVMEEADGQRSASFLTYDSAAGLLRALPSAPAGSTLQNAGADAYFLAETPQTLTASASLYALRNQGQILDLGIHTLTFNTSNFGVAGLILNGGVIRGGTLNFSSETVIYTSMAGATIGSDITSAVQSFDNGLTFFGPGAVTLSGEVSFVEGSSTSTVNSGTLRIDGTIQGNIDVQPEATLGGSGIVQGAISGGLLSPGNGPGILTANALKRAERADAFSSGISPTSFAFEFSRAGMPDFSDSTDSGNDLLRLTNSTAPFVTPLGSESEISLFFQTNGLQFGDQFYGGFYTDRRADFSTAFENATFHVYLRDPAGSFLFEGEHYSLNESLDLAITTVPLSADFGAGPIAGQIMQIQVVPEPTATAFLIASLLGTTLIRRRRPRSC